MDPRDGKVYLPIHGWLGFFHGFHVGRYTTPMDPMGMEYPVVISFHLKKWWFPRISFSSIFRGALLKFQGGASRMNSKRPANVIGIVMEWWDVEVKNIK